MCASLSQRGATRWARRCVVALVLLMAQGPGGGGVSSRDGVHPCGVPAAADLTLHPAMRRCSLRPAPGPTLRGGGCGEGGGCGACGGCGGGGGCGTGGGAAGEESSSGARAALDILNEMDLGVPTAPPRSTCARAACGAGSCKRTWADAPGPAGAAERRERERGGSRGRARGACGAGRRGAGAAG